MTKAAKRFNQHFKGFSLSSLAFALSSCPKPSINKWFTKGGQIPRGRPSPAQQDHLRPVAFIASAEDVDFVSPHTKPTVEYKTPQERKAGFIRLAIAVRRPELKQAMTQHSDLSWHRLGANSDGSSRITSVKTENANYLVFKNIDMTHIYLALSAHAAGNHKESAECWRTAAELGIESTLEQIEQDAGAYLHV